MTRGNLRETSTATRLKAFFYDRRNRENGHKLTSKTKSTFFKSEDILKRRFMSCVRFLGELLSALKIRQPFEEFAFCGNAIYSLR